MLSVQFKWFNGHFLFAFAILALSTFCIAVNAGEEQRGDAKRSKNLGRSPKHLEDVLDSEGYHERLTFDNRRLVVMTFRAAEKSIPAMPPGETVAESYISSEGRTVYGEILKADGSHKVACWSAGKYGLWIETYPKSAETGPKKALYLFRHKDMKLILVLEIKSDGVFDLSPDEEFLAVVRKNQPDLDLSEAENLGHSK